MPNFSKFFPKKKNILSIDGDTIVVGDIHGSFHDLLRILHFSNSKNSNVLFLGDYVDRGEFSLECITILFALKVINLNSYFLSEETMNLIHYTASAIKTNSSTK